MIQFACFLALSQIGLGLPPRPSIILAATLCSCDTVAPLTFINPKTHGEGLFSVIFGEGVVNDVISILLVSVVCFIPESQLTLTLLTYNVL